MSTAPTLLDEEFVAFISDPDQRADPYPFYHRLRSADPVRNATRLGLVDLAAVAEHLHELR